ncbi:hypothetical protein M9H77_33658 [Catharanthus roseus]|uniref:Uncharacterized protein n=1 Tax=Catharanthus roseus TaxID=4058 RepID=A0ACB9ZJR7_CATRO|nr:hypothetical protein M9H77_33658 [Catharanthus roseus]
MEQRGEDDIDEKVWKDNFDDGIQSEEACLAFHDQDYVEKIKEFHFYLDSGLGNNTKDYDRLALILKEYGVPTVFLKVSRIDWLRNAAGLIDPNYWREALRPRPVLDWKMFEAIGEANEMGQAQLQRDCLEWSRGLLDYAKKNCPKAVYTPELRYVCGQADVWGDGVVPEISAHLEGALNISLEGVYHSPVGSDDVTRPWYGSPQVVEQWVQHLLH